MRQPVLVLGIEFGRGLAQLGQKKMRIVAEAVVTTRFAPDLAPPAAFADQRLRVGRVAHQHHGAIIVGAAVGAGGERGYQFVVVARVALFAAGCVTSIARRVHAGLAAKRDRTQSGIIRQRGHTCALGHMARFRQRVLDEGEVRLLRVRDAQFGLSQDLATQRTEYGPDFAQLAGVATGDDELIHGSILPWLLLVLGTLVAAAGFIASRWTAGFLGLALCLLLENLARMWRGETALKNQFV